MNDVVIDRELARKVLSVVDAGLVHGMGEPEPGKMCVEAAVNYAMGRPHGDDPSCVAPSLRQLKIKLNDSCWSSPQARAKGLRRLAIAQLGSAGALDEKEFKKRVATLAIQSCVPSAFRAAATVLKSPHKEQLIKWADVCEKEPTEQHAREARKAAYAYAAASYAADAAAYYAAAASAAADAYAYYAAADAYAYAAAAASASYAADAAAYYAAADAAAAKNAARDKVLAAFAEGVVQILIDMKAPGCEWLDLAPCEYHVAFGVATL